MMKLCVYGGYILYIQYMCTNMRKPCAHTVHKYTYIKMQMLVLLKKFREVTKDVEELGCLSMSVKLLLSAVQRDFEMEILRRRSELGAVEGCERETDDTISPGRFPHAYCQASTFPHPTPNIFTQVQTHTHTHIDRPVLTEYRNTTHQISDYTHMKCGHAHKNNGTRTEQQLTSNPSKQLL